MTLPSVILTGRPDRTPAYDPAKGEHCWATIAIFKVSIDPAATSTIGDLAQVTIADEESLLSLSEPGCVYCEQLWMPEVAARRCYGPPVRPLDPDGFLA